MTKHLIFFSFSKKKQKQNKKKQNKEKNKPPKLGLSPECRISDLHIIYFSLSIFIKLNTLCKDFGLFIREGGGVKAGRNFFSSYTPNATSAKSIHCVSVSEIYSFILWFWRNLSQTLYFKTQRLDLSKKKFIFVPKSSIFSPN